MPPVRHLSLAALSLALAACASPAPQAVAPAQGAGQAAAPVAIAARTASIQVRPSYRDGAVRRLLATLTPYTISSINHMQVDVYTVDGLGNEAFVDGLDVAAADLTNTITFGNLAHNTDYRIRATAYKAAGTAAGDKISTDGASYVDLSVGLDDRPTLGDLEVTLIDQTFSGEATSTGLTVNDGLIVHSGSLDSTMNTAAVYGMVGTLTGDGSAAFADGSGAAGKVDSPHGVAVDASGNVYVGDKGNRRVRKVTPAGAMSTIAGSGAQGSADGAAASATFDSPGGLAVDRNGDVYVLDTGSDRLRRITPDGQVSTVAGSSQGFTDATGAGAQFANPAAIAFGADGNMYVADTDNHRIRKVTRAGVVTTFAGSGNPGGTDDTGTAAEFNLPTGIAADKFGNFFVGEFGGHRVRKITPAGVVTTYAGTGVAGQDNGAALSATFQGTWGIALDHAGTVYVADADNDVIRKITKSGTVSTLAAAFGVFGFQDGALGSARFHNMRGLAFASTGELYVADATGCRVRKLIAP